MSKHTLLEIKDLHVNVEDKEILDGVDLSIGSDETHVLMLSLIHILYKGACSQGCILLLQIRMEQRKNRLYNGTQA